ncbi:hypothetical protein [Shewanella halifaxensis]|uniref:hypothetical protein n=1 Tax=Shewanella halifaxensis TaxID=271098 RepID=UPI0002D2623A|nr:hypothetical protein [Shewanella halifaxensis]
MQNVSISRYRTRTIISKLGLVVTQRQAYKETTKHTEQANHAWVGDASYLWTH